MAPSNKRSKRLQSLQQSTIFIFVYSQFQKKTKNKQIKTRLPQYIHQFSPLPSITEAKPPITLPTIFEVLGRKPLGFHIISSSPRREWHPFLLHAQFRSIRNNVYDLQETIGFTHEDIGKHLENSFVAFC
ncbi:hypothetical protein Ccrd_017809 [Cynara cardunculus var. scolymus]|uniref:Uncharacterized protein n=1 Tax=Cynara cardunculus var. scolymus TaxID=59895 RepID=A0A103Y7E4_CYNCS|nr:hypothetical protein Ccrd_017809 [Cynara cardunculus var. scolymus]